jgi:NTE family protein
MLMYKHKKIGLVLGSGSARGWAHIGAIDAIEEAGIPIHCIAGTSIGAFVGAVYATGDLASLKEFALQMDWKKVISYFDVVFPKSGFMDGKKVHELFSIHTEAKTFDDFKIPVNMIATDLKTGKKVVIDSGNIIEGIRASVSVPGVFTPAKRGDRWLVGVIWVLILLSPLISILIVLVMITSQRSNQLRQQCQIEKGTN